MFRRRGNRCRARTTHRRLALNVSAARPRRVVVCSCLTVCGPACRAIGSRDSNRPERTSLQYTSGTGGPPLAPPMGVQVPVVKVSRVSPRCRGMLPRCRGRVAVCRASVAGGSRRRRGLSRRRRGLSRCRRGGSPCRKVSRGVAGCRGRVAACPAAVAVCRAAVAGGSRSVAPPSRSVAPPSSENRLPLLLVPRTTRPSPSRPVRSASRLSCKSCDCI